MLNRPGFMRLGQLEEERRALDPIVVPPAEFFRPMTRIDLGRALWHSRLAWLLAGWWAGIFVGGLLEAIKP